MEVSQSVSQSVSQIIAEEYHIIIYPNIIIMSLMKNEKITKGTGNGTGKKKSSNYNPSKLGRKGDPRMHAALQSRLADPNLDLMTALENGGFVFSDALDGSICDADNISLNQRKNQLSRRIRVYKQRNKDKGKECPNLANLRTNGHGNGNGNGNGVGNINGHGHGLGHGNTLDESLKRMTMSMNLNMTSNGYTCARYNPLINGYHNPYVNVNNTGMNVDVSGDRNNYGQDSHSGMKRRMQTQMNMNMNNMQMQMPPLQIQSLHEDPSLMKQTQNYNFDRGQGRDRERSHAKNGSDNESDLVNENLDLNANLEKDPKLETALENFRVGIVSLFKKTMIQAGYKTSQTDECDEAYLTFAETALHGEMKRVRRIKKRLYPAVHVSSPAPAPVSMSTPTKRDRERENGEHSNQLQQQQQQQHSREGSPSRLSSGTNYDNSPNRSHGHNGHGRNGHDNEHEDEHSGRSHSHARNNRNGDGHDHEHKHNEGIRNANAIANANTNANANANATATASNGNINKKLRVHNRHLHRLEKGCGHKAIVHKPIGGNPHIDFVVDDKVECYHGLNPFMDASTFWPSALAKSEGNNPSHDHNHANVNANANAGGASGGKRANGTANVNANGGTDKNDQGEGSNCQASAFDPIVFDLKDVDLACGEWESILTEGDADPDNEAAALGGLFSLQNKAGV